MAHGHSLSRDPRARNRTLRNRKMVKRRKEWPVLQVGIQGFVEVVQSLPQGISVFIGAKGLFCLVFFEEKPDSCNPIADIRELASLRG
jgi:hypothetical protein